MKAPYFKIATLSLTFWFFTQPSYGVNKSRSADEGESGHEIKVNLLGDTCTLKGPFNEVTLKMIHALGPAHIEIDAFTSRAKEKISRLKEELRSSLKSLNESNSKASRAFDDYVSRQIKRLEGLDAYFEGVELLQRSKKKEEFLRKVSAFLPPTEKNDLDKTIADLIKAPSGSASRRELGEQLFDLYASKLDDPEKDFHRAIRQLKVQYNCFYEASEANPQD